MEGGGRECREGKKGKKEVRSWKGKVGVWCGGEKFFLSFTFSQIKATPNSTGKGLILNQFFPQAPLITHQIKTFIN